MVITYEALLKHLWVNDLSLFLCDHSLGYLETATPVHNQAALGKLWKESLWRVLPPVDRIRNYFGEEVGFYWAWMTFYTLFLIVPAFAGMALFLLNTIEGEELLQ